MNDCPNCEYHRQRAARWRAEAYKLGGYDGIEIPWKGLTDRELMDAIYLDDTPMEMGRRIEAKLKEKNT
jgi:hypothetical protein